MKPEKIYVVFKTHVDLGFTDLPSKVVQQYKHQMMDDVLTVCEATADNPPGHRYVWTLPAWMLKQCLNEDDAQRRERLEKLVRDGQLCWHGLPFTTHTEFCGVEEYMRGLYMNEELNRKYGKEVISAKMTDVPGHTWMLPSLLRQAGIQFLHLGVNSCSAPVDLPRLFWWEGPDGSRVLTWYSAGEYGTSLLPPEDWHYPVWLALMQTHDNIGPQSSDIVSQLLEDVAAKYPDAEVQLGTMDDFARDFIARGYSDIPVIRKDLADSWIHGVGTYPAEVSSVRQLRYDLAAKESLNAVNHNRAGSAGPTEAIRQGYEQTLLFGEHTWGIDIKSNLLPGRHGGRAIWAEDIARDRAAFPETYAKTEQSWEEQRDYVRKANRFASEASPSIVPIAGQKVAAYNPLPRERQSSPIWIDVDSAGWLRDPVNGERFRVNGRGEASVGPIGPLAARSFIWEPDASAELGVQLFEPCETDGVIENSSIRIEVNAKTGTIFRFQDKRNGKEWASEGFGTYLYEVFGKQDMLKFVKDYAYDLTDWYINDFSKPGYPRIPYARYEAQAVSVESRRIGKRQEIRIRYGVSPDSRGEFGNAESAMLTVALEEDGDGADFTLQLSDKKKTAFAEAGHFVLPLLAKRPQYRLQKMGSVVNPLEDIARGANFRLHCVDQWVDVCDEDGTGLAVFPLDTPLCSLGESGVYKYDLVYEPEQPVLLFNLFNNQWGTNFPQWIGGDFTYRFHIVPHDGDWKQARLEERAEQLRYPLQAYLPITEEKPAIIEPLLMESVYGVRWLAVKPAENGDAAMVCRWMNVSDETREITFRFNRTYSEIVRCSGVEREIEKLPLQNGTVTVHARPFEIVTLKLRQEVTIAARC
ncbi:DUF5054 domain-containing protein [Cohnella luojiensis]|uniref:DUF5054 domain-containing protein n=1 Tax=Cohnella luojiensis TaxID=652876 RepID=A0A4Y8LTL2_9BACL|nr:DUF5054 domain-containing protein [Cohnella luojiensis]TFE24249.1 DUF5054 domain-containing protein [Cohnella luojiensis]